MRALLLVGLPLVLGAAAPAQGARFSYPRLLSRLTDFDWLWYPPAAGERCVQFSSYDRSSDKGPGDFDAWYGNDDRGKYLRVDDKDGKKEYVMVDVDGPGVLSRIWSANPSGVLQFDIDGQRVWSVDFAALCSGKVTGIPEPLAGVRSRGWNCHLPIPFSKHLKVSASKGDFSYQCNTLLFGKGTAVPSFAPAMLEQYAEPIREVAHRLRSGSPVRPTYQWRSADAGANAGGRSPGVIRGRVVVEELSLNVVRPSHPVDLGEVLRRVVLVVRCGDEETVRVPVLDFFCGGADWRPWRGYPLRIDDDGWAYAYWPMPMPEGGSIDLEVQGDLEGVAVSVAAFTRGMPITFVEPLLFRASYHQQKGVPSRPFRDFLVLDAKGGPGRFVGCSLLVKNPTRGWWGEGDEKFFVDGETFPSTFGTGTEDYFGYAWRSPETFQSAFHAQTQCDGPGNYGFSALHRTQILDAVPFQRSFRFDFEVWHWVDKLQMDYATVAYWYGAAGAASGLPPVPAVAERTLDRLPPRPVFVAKDAIEGERLKVLSVSGGSHEVQDLSFRENTFSRDAHLWWKHGKPGDTLLLELPVAEAGEYKVTAAFCKADDYGIVQCAIDDQKLGEPFDGFATRVESSGPVALGTAKLAAGVHKLAMTITGKRDDAKRAYMVGLDYLRLEKVR